jgi:hypothetical protein
MKRRNPMPPEMVRMSLLLDVGGKRELVVTVGGRSIVVPTPDEAGPMRVEVRERDRGGGPKLSVNPGSLSPEALHAHDTAVAGLKTRDDV